MTTNVVEIQGTLHEDGTLVLDQKPDLPPGRVKVTVEPVPDYRHTEIWQFFERLWAEQRARGHVPRTREEIDAELEASRQEDEERMQELERIHEECERHRRQQGQSDRPRHRAEPRGPAEVRRLSHQWSSGSDADPPQNQ